MSTHQNKWQRIERVRQKLLGIERASILAALEEGNWLVARAARLLRPDIATSSWLAAMLRTNTPRGRHADLGELVRERSAEGGYTFGRPATNYGTRVAESRAARGCVCGDSPKHLPSCTAH